MSPLHLSQMIYSKSNFFAFYIMLRLLAEEEDKMKALMNLQEEQEEYIAKTQREKQELKQEMEAKSRALEEAQRQLEEVRANRHRVDQDVVVGRNPDTDRVTQLQHVIEANTRQASGP